MHVCLCACICVCVLYDSSQAYRKICAVSLTLNHLATDLVYSWAVKQSGPRRKLMDAVGHWNRALNTQFPDHSIWMVSYTYSASALSRTNFLTACKQCPKMSSKPCLHIGMSMSLVMVRNYWKYPQTVDSLLGHNYHSQWPWTLSKTWLLYLWQRLKDFIGKQTRKWALELSNLHIHHHGRAQNLLYGKLQASSL